MLDVRKVWDGHINIITDADGEDDDDGDGDADGGEDDDADDDGGEDADADDGGEDDDADDDGGGEDADADDGGDDDGGEDDDADADDGGDADGGGGDVGLLSERQCIARNARRQETNKMKRRPHRLGVVSVQGHSVTSASPVRNDVAVCTSTAAAVVAASVDQSPPHCHSPLQLLNDDQRDLISLLVAFQDKYDLPTDEDVRKVSVWRTFSCVRISVSVSQSE